MKKSGFRVRNQFSDINRSQVDIPDDRQVHDFKREQSKPYHSGDNRRIFADSHGQIDRVPIRPGSISACQRNVPLLIFFHGGGMTGGEREVPEKVFDGEFAVAEPRYRLSPAAKAPAQIEDAAQCIAWCFAHDAEYSVDPHRIFVGGMSAGAYLAAVAIMNPVFLMPYGLHYRQVAGLALISGQMTTHFRVKVDLGRDNGPYNPLVDEYSPLGNLAPDLPPVLMVTGDSGCDIPARPEENAFMAASLRTIGHSFVRCYSLPDHTHIGTLESCDFLLMKFLHEVMERQKPESAPSA